MTLALGRYTEINDGGPHGLPITYRVRTGRDEAFVPTLRRGPVLLVWLAQRFGPYPFPSAGGVLVDALSAMETQQMITYGVRLGADPGNPLSGRPPPQSTVEEVLVHEYAH